MNEWEISLNGGWLLSREDGAFEAVCARVPGTVLSALFKAGKIKDPFYRTNEAAARELAEYDYSYEREFTVPEEFFAAEELTLDFDGIDTLGEILVNGTLLGTTRDMHRSYSFACKKLLQAGKNRIQIRLHSPLRYLKEYVPEEGKEIYCVAAGGMERIQYLRKAHSQFGWDWGPQLPDAGIFKSVTLRKRTPERLMEVRFEQLHEACGVRLFVHTRTLGEQENSAVRTETLIRLFAPDGTLLEEKKSTEGTTEFLIERPKLWWPNGLGEQPLYRVEVHTAQEENRMCVQVKAYEIGLRTLSVSREKDAYGQEFAFCVNGKKFFAMGANYIPEDALYGRITRERTKKLLEECREANFNCIRVWGGGYFPEDYFYEYCDRYGLVVWQDLMFACLVYDLTETFAEDVVEETRDNLKRIRHHACLGLICGNNEMESAWNHWGSFIHHSPRLKADYIKQFEYLLPRVAKEVAGEIFYWPSSPSSGGCFEAPDSEQTGDAHYWEVWHEQKPFTEYQKHYFRFCSEYGFQSFPCMRTVAAYTEPEDRNIFSEVMEAHQKSDAANGKILYYLSENFLYPKDFESLLYVSQLLQGIAIKSGAEHFRRNRGRCMGAIYWQLNDNWPVASWSSIDYFGRWKALHYMAKEFFAPFAASLKIEETRAEGWLSNETGAKRRASVTLRLKDMSFHTLSERKAEETVPAFTSLCALTEDYKAVLETVDKREVYVEFTRTDPTTGEEQKEVQCFLPYKHMRLENPKLTAFVEEETDAFVIRITGERAAFFVELSLKNADAVFESNYGMLTTAEGLTIRLQKERLSVTMTAEQLKKELLIRSLYDSVHEKGN